jgi:hypothetical protein
VLDVPEGVEIVALENSVRVSSCISMEGRTLRIGTDATPIRLQDLMLAHRVSWRLSEGQVVPAGNVELLVGRKQVRPGRRSVEVDSWKPDIL